MYSRSYPNLGSNELMIQDLGIQNYLLPYGPLILMGPKAMGMGPIIDVFNHWKF